MIHGKLERENIIIIDFALYWAHGTTPLLSPLPRFAYIPHTRHRMSMPHARAEDGTKRHFELAIIFEPLMKHYASRHAQRKSRCRLSISHAAMSIYLYVNGRVPMHDD